MLLYNKLISRVTRKLPDFLFLTTESLFIKSLVSLRYDLDCWTIGARKRLTNPDVHFVALSFVDTIGLPSTSLTFVCIFGGRHL